MNQEIHKQIYNELNLRETDDLLNIWKENNHFEWSNETFDVIKEILKARRIEIPEQDEPIYEYSDEDDEFKDDDFSDEELKILDDENPPEFYKPFEVIKFGRWLDLTAKAMIILLVIQGLFGFSSSQNIVRGYFIGNPGSSLILPFTFLIMAANVTIGILITYLPLIALSKILRILMEMEFNSRKAR